MNKSNLTFEITISDWWIEYIYVLNCIGGWRKSGGQTSFLRHVPAGFVSFTSNELL